MSDTKETPIRPGDTIDPALDPDLDRISRRSLFKRAGAAATVATVTPLASAAQGVRALDDPTLDKQAITYTSHASGTATEIKAFLAGPKSGEKRGSVMVVHEIFGLTDHIKDVACRLARAGFEALAINLFTREGEPPSMTGGFEPLMKFVGQITDLQIMSDLDAAAAFLRGRHESNGKVGIVGFCWGGRVSMLYAAHSRRLDAAVAYYGRITGQPTENQPASPLDLAARIHAPLLGHFGGKDTSIPETDVNALREALHLHHKTVELNVYPEAGHAFNNDTRPSYNAEVAATSWKRTLEWFHKYVGS